MGGAQSGGAQQRLLDKEHSAYTLCVCHTLKGVYKCMGMHIFNIQA